MHSIKMQKKSSILGEPLRSSPMTPPLIYTYHNEGKVKGKP